MTTNNAIRALSDRAMADIQGAASLTELEKIRVSLLGKKGEITALLKTLQGLDPAERRTVGAEANSLKQELTTQLEEKKKVLEAAELSLPHAIDVTLPGVPPLRGGLHPTVQLMYDLNDAFQSLNFDIYEGPELSSEHFEFDNMNFPADHPARESMDTYWISGSEDRRGNERTCLRPHLTGASVRYMQTHKPPFRFVYPGRVYRNEATDPRHERAFFQYEALIVEKKFAFPSGKLLVNTILDTVFGKPAASGQGGGSIERRTRMRSGFFPFVEPGFEIDMECMVCGGSGCRVCKNVGWLEIMPGGVPHPNVLRAGNIDPDEWTGFYINVGLDRLVMMRYGIDDVRLFHSADLRFLSQYK